MTAQTALEDILHMSAPAHKEEHHPKPEGKVAGHIDHGKKGKGDHPANKHDPVQEFYGRNKKLQAWINTHEVYHSHVYTSSIEEIAKQADGTIDLSVLKTKKGQDALVDKLMENYLQKAKDVHGLEAKAGSEFTKRDLLYLMSGHTRETLTEAVKSQKDNYTLDMHRQTTRQHIQALRQRHSPYVADAVEPRKDRGTLLKFMNIDDAVAKEWDDNEVFSKFQEYVGTDVGEARYQKAYGGKKESHAKH
jgi:hypothetical protein